MTKDDVQELLGGLPRALAFLRESRGFTQRELARVTRERDEPVPNSSIARYEAGTVSPNLESLGRICGALGVGWQELGEVLQAVQRGEVAKSGETVELGGGAGSRASGFPVRLLVELGSLDLTRTRQLLRSVGLSDAVLDLEAGKAKEAVAEGSGEEAAGEAEADSAAESSEEEARETGG